MEDVLDLYHQEYNPGASGSVFRRDLPALTGEVRPPIEAKTTCIEARSRGKD